MMEPRLSLITLGVADLDRAVAFYEALGFPRKVRAARAAAFFRLGPLALSLYPRANLARDAGVPFVGGPMQGVTLAHNTRTRAEVDAVMDAAAGASPRRRRMRSGAAITATSPTRTGFCGRWPGTPGSPSGRTERSACRSSAAR